MDKNSKPKCLIIEGLLSELAASGLVPAKHLEELRHFYEEIQGALFSANRPLEPFYGQFCVFLSLLKKQLKTPFVFEAYHPKIRSYHQFGLDFVRQLIDLDHSTVFGLDTVDRIAKQLEAGENVILFANHQTETDPIAIAIALEKTHPDLAQRIISVAGERVVTDPLAIPFSMGCDLLCIYSKRYIDHPIELKAKKQLHNKNTMVQMSQLLSEGSKIIYVAPSGGRDRRNASGVIEVAPFDPQSIEMFYLMARKSKRTTHFYPLTLATYELLPPPETIQFDLGEKRRAKFSPIHLSFSLEFDMETFPGSDTQERAEKRKNRARALWNIVNHEHQKMLAL